jgi:hypothetical protein
MVVDNYATHKHPKVRAWLARRPRWHIHFTPTYASWLNQVERFFALITQRAIRRGSFVSTADLVKKIDHFIRTLNANSCPFVWTATADSILETLSANFRDGTLETGYIDARPPTTRSMNLLQRTAGPSIRVIRPALLVNVTLSSFRTAV